MEFLKEVATLEYEEWADKPEEDKEARIKRKMEKIKIKLKGKDFCKLILLDDDKLIGFISIFPQDCDECQKLSPWYATMYVKKEYRNQDRRKVLFVAKVSENCVDKQKFCENFCYTRSAVLPRFRRRIRFGNQQLFP